MMDDSHNPTSTPDTGPLSEQYRQATRRLRVEAGLPPWGPIIHPRSEEESAERIRQLREPTAGYKGLIRPTVKPSDPPPSLNS